MGSCASKKPQQQHQQQDHESIKNSQKQQQQSKRAQAYLDEDKENNNNQTKAAESDNKEKEKEHQFIEQNQQQQQQQNLNNQQNSLQQLDQKANKDTLQSQQLPINLKGQKNITNDQRWSNIIQKGLIEYTAQKFVSSKCDIQVFNQTIQEIIDALQFNGNNENKMIIIQKCENQILIYYQGIDHKHNNELKQIYEQFNQKIQPYLHFLNLNSDHQKQCYNSILSTILSIFMYFNNLYYDSLILSDGTLQENKNNLSNQKLKDFMVNQIDQTKNDMFQDFPILQQYNVYQKIGKVQSNVYLNELYTNVQRQFRRNKTHHEIGNEYLTMLYEDVIQVVEEMIPNDEPKNQMHKITQYVQSYNFEAFHKKNQIILTLEQQQYQQQQLQQQNQIQTVQG